MKIFIIGYMGAGKSTVGRRLANRLNIPFIDLDDAFESKFRYSIHRFFDQFGETRFRELEHQCLLEVTSENENAVISTGGGTPCFHSNMELMDAAGTTIYLKMHPGSLAHRLSKARKPRPVIRNIHNDDVQTFIEQQLAEREKYYTRAHITVKGEDLDMEKLVEAVMKR
ncbi:MAG: shikimate kinase [Bacteroidota bacterium]